MAHTTTHTVILMLATTITTTAISNITGLTATSGGNITADGGAAITARGVCWSTATGPTIAGSKTTDGTGIGSYISSLTGLSPGTTYYLRTYATNSTTTTYGNEISFIDQLESLNIIDLSSFFYKNIDL